MVKWAERELNRLLTGDEDSDKIQRVINSNILDLVKIFAKQGHSGLSASYVISVLYRLLKFKPLTPLTGEDDEWNEIQKGVYQNRRYSAVFKDNKDNSTAYNIEGKVFSDDGGKTWFTNRSSLVPVTFPYSVPNEPEFIILSKEEKNNEVVENKPN